MFQGDLINQVWVVMRNEHVINGAHGNRDLSIDGFTPPTHEYFRNKLNINYSFLYFTQDPCW